MIHCNLATLLAERKLKISKVAEDTGLSRTTLTSMYYNQGSGIQLNTIDKLCIYLDIAINQLYSFFPFDLYCVRCEWHGQDSINLTLSYADKRHKKKDIDIFGQLDISKNEDGLINYMGIILDYYLSDAEEYDSESGVYEKLVKQACLKLPQSVKYKLKNDISVFISDMLYTGDIADNCTFVTSFPPLD